MNLIAPWLFIAGICIALFSTVWFLVVAFRRHLAWGLAVLLVPFANFIFLICAWRVAKRPFFLACFGGVLVLAGTLSDPQNKWRQMLLTHLPQTAAAASETAPEEKASAAAISAPSAATVNDLRLREQMLRARKASLDLRDAQAVTALARDIDAYNHALSARAAAAAAEKNTAPPPPPPPPPSLWIEDVAKAQIPVTPAAGAMAGEPFVVQRAVIENGVLSLRQDSGGVANHEFMLFLFLNGRSPAGRNFQVTPESRVGSLHVHMKRSVKNQKKSEPQIFMNGYGLRLEFAERVGNEIPGRIYLCMPDAAKSYVAGVFRARVLDKEEITISRR
jgi:hypothetical protein